MDWKALYIGVGLRVMSAVGAACADDAKKPNIVIIWGDDIG
jgi:hypothetical protein